MKIINNNTKCGYCKNTLRTHSKELDRINEGYDANRLICEGYILALYKNKLINKCEKKWLTKIYIDCVETDDGLASRYSINKNGEVEDCNDDTIED